MKTTKQPLIEIALDDLKASEILFQNGLYPQSIFYSQQAVEKILKQVGINNGVIRKDELSDKIGHKTEKILKRMVKETKHLTNNSDDIDAEYDKLKQFVDKHDIGDFRSVISDQLKGFREAVLSFQDIDDLMTAIINKMYPDFFKSMEDNQAFKTTYELKKKKFIEAFPNYVKSGMILFALNLVLSGYVSIVRYPIKDSFENPSLIFNKYHPLVEMLPELHDHIRFVIRSISNENLQFN
jgi:HEPN domain-containing protein